MLKRDPGAPRIGTLIGKSVEVSGDVQFEGGLHLDGRIAGGVRSDSAPTSTLTVSESGAIEGAVRVPNVFLKGTVRGDIHAAERLVMGATARVEGNVYYRVIEMAQGAQILGKLVQLGHPAGAPELDADTIARDFT
jgi:cytoskeletal protein CcmA (bactofilin family)